MSSEVASATDRRAYVRILYRTMFFLTALVVLRFVLELIGAPEGATRALSSTAGLFLAVIYIAAVAPLRDGMKKFRQLLLPSLLLSAWTVGWVILATLVAALFRLGRSHFAEADDYGNWGHLGHHIFEHVIEIGVIFIIVFILMALTHLLWRWPVIVGPGAVLGALVIIRFWVEAMGMERWQAAAWSSSVAMLLCGFYLGGIGPRFGLSSPRRLLPPALAVAWVWRLFIYLATLLSALVPFYKTHFFDRSGDRIVARLAGFFILGVLLEGLIWGLLVWGIAVWISRATRKPVEA
jgi:hypothetical protein